MDTLSGDWACAAPFLTLLLLSFEQHLSFPLYSASGVLQGKAVRCAAQVHQGAELRQWLLPLTSSSLRVCCLWYLGEIRHKVTPLPVLAGSVYAYSSSKGDRLATAIEWPWSVFRWISVPMFLPEKKNCCAITVKNDKNIVREETTF